MKAPPSPAHHGAPPITEPSAVLTLCITLSTREVLLEGGGEESSPGADTDRKEVERPRLLHA